jgi:hypothetical protein
VSDDTISILRPADSTDSTLVFPVPTTGPGSEETGSAPTATGSAPTAGPVFVDATGRRRRRVRRVGLTLLVLAAGYLTLVVSTALGGPTVDAPFLPLPAPPDATERHASGHVPSVKHRTAPRSGGKVAAGAGSQLPDSAVNATQSGSAASSASSVSASPSSVSSASTSASPTGSASAGPSASPSPGQTTAAPTANGKSHASTAPGASHRPVKS